MKKVLFAFAALIALTACGNKQAAAPETESSEVTNEVITNDTISQEMKEANMQEVQAYLKECGAFFIATADGDQPHVRPFGYPAEGAGPLANHNSRKPIEETVTYL